MRFPPVLLTQLWGLLCGAALGALRTRQAAAHLLAKNHLLEAAGLPHLPGAGHWEVLSSAGPVWAGALFFGLSLGLGAGSLCAVWCRLTRHIPGQTGVWLPRAVLVLPLPALVAGDPGLAGCLLAISLGAVVFHRAAEPARTLVLRLALVGVCASGLVPWALAQEGPFTRLRDQVLFANPAGQAVDRFYYRWTLYPAEVLKPLAAKTQPVIAIPAELAAAERRRWCRDARRLGVLCVDSASDSPGVDLGLVLDAGTPALVSDATRQPWPSGAAAQREAWRKFSAARDSALPLRRATGLALFLGCPLGLCWLLSSGAFHLASVFPRGRRHRVAAALVTAAVALGLGSAGMEDPEVAALRAGLAEVPPDSPERLAGHLRSPRIAERFYAARAASRLGRTAEPLLLDALADPVINVRYAAAQALGDVGGDTARAALDELLQQPEEWYVKERAYASLKKIGWPSP